jgi:hypothetical protein
MDMEEGSESGCQVFGIPLGLIALAMLAMLAHLIVGAQSSRRSSASRRLGKAADGSAGLP